MRKIWDILFFPIKKVTTLYDRYIIQKFFTTSIFAFLIFVSIAIVIDYSEKTDHFLKKKPKTEEIFGYYMDFIPYIGSILAPLLIFLAVMFFTARLAYNSEIIAVLNSGATFRRFLRPYIICGILAATFLLFANHWIVPEANKGRNEFEQKYIRPPKSAENNIHLRVDTNTLVSLQRYKFSNNEGTNFSLEKYVGKGGTKKLLYKINADKIQMLPGENKWRLSNYQRWTIHGLQEDYTTGKTLDTVLNMQPDDFNISITSIETLNFDEMESYMEEEKIKGTGGLELYIVEKYRRTSSAISVIILVLIGAALGSKKVRGGIGLNLVAGIALSSIFVVFQQFSSTFSTKGSLPPLIGTNIPNIIFILITIYVIRISSK